MRKSTDTSIKSRWKSKTNYFLNKNNENTAIIIA